ncbi:GNAT family N-acetyltransferase [Frankia sp. CNm7]|nr:GNAT family N-acetyltransferase [Frankia nepalensis]MBL7509725.1 GNAT family N-acetyltransferase [Frankia nepalensis]MBL7516927.1 GNAT family N-acetyltransferase [Frankia nepalensis]
MRPATSDDIPAVTRMLLARCEWLEERGLPTWRASVGDLAGQADNPDGTKWLLVHDDRTVIGCTTILDSAPPWGWTAEELAEPAHYLYTTATDPTYRAVQPGALIALWAVDRAHREGRRWVRRGCLHPALVRYYENQGFTLRYKVQRTHNLVYLLERPAESLPDLQIATRSTLSAGEHRG